ncbi:uncharacterized protein I303_108501 [Kwoniella dejecticola CBS 10117]|uniref:Uncharacterized protein n=1 Tax=Kwoniella dejecticola CBS 10117 TaxID=1296121 RepID=A0A1A5ZX86_9TREE|nr:uncharacterized protein I303_07175 [Kwoniella dejecticola CBS 10117]OBR82416.1 hypothetical protein I303_07175 [Kwoniella dejecticola CBS 10117]
MSRHSSTYNWYQQQPAFQVGSDPTINGGQGDTPVATRSLQSDISPSQDFITGEQCRTVLGASARAFRNIRGNLYPKPNSAVEEEVLSREGQSWTYSLTKQGGSSQVFRQKPGSPEYEPLEDGDNVHQGFWSATLRLDLTKNDLDTEQWEEMTKFPNTLAIKKFQWIAPSGSRVNDNKTGRTAKRQDVPWDRFAGKYQVQTCKGSHCVKISSEGLHLQVVNDCTVDALDRTMKAEVTTALDILTPEFTTWPEEPTETNQYLQSPAAAQSSDTQHGLARYPLSAMTSQRPGTSHFPYQNAPPVGFGIQQPDVHNQSGHDGSYPLRWDAQSQSWY